MSHYINGVQDPGGKQHNSAKTRHSHGIEFSGIGVYDMLRCCILIQCTMIWDLVVYTLTPGYLLLDGAKVWFFWPQDKEKGNQGRRKWKHSQTIDI